MATYREKKKAVPRSCEVGFRLYSMAIRGVVGQLPESGDGRRLQSSLDQSRGDKMFSVGFSLDVVGVMRDSRLPLGSGVTDGPDPSVSGDELGLRTPRSALFLAFALAFFIT